MPKGIRYGVDGVEAIHNICDRGNIFIIPPKVEISESEIRAKPSSRPMDAQNCAQTKVKIVIRLHK